MNGSRKIYRSTSDYMIAGVAGGIAEYFDIDPVIIRVIFVVLALGGGSGILIYLILWLVLPPNPKKTNPKLISGVIKQNDQKNVRQRGVLPGLILLILGVVVLWNQILPDSIRWDLLWPIFLIFFGVFLIFRR